MRQPQSIGQRQPKETRSATQGGSRLASSVQCWGFILTSQRDWKLDMLCICMHRTLSRKQKTPWVVDLFLLFSSWNWYRLPHCHNQSAETARILPLTDVLWPVASDLPPCWFSISMDQVMRYTSTPNTCKKLESRSLNGTNKDKWRKRKELIIERQPLLKRLQATVRFICLQVCSVFRCRVAPVIWLSYCGMSGNL